LNASQASVSQWLAEIESAFGVRLFERGRQLKATAFVGPVLSLCQRTLDDVERTKFELDALQAGQAGRVSLGFQHGAGLSLVPKAVLRMKTQLPKLLVDLREDIAAMLWPRFLRRQHDILVVRLHDRAFAEGTVAKCFSTTCIRSSVHRTIPWPTKVLQAGAKLEATLGCCLQRARHCAAASTTRLLPLVWRRHRHGSKARRSQATSACWRVQACCRSFPVAWQKGSLPAGMSPCYRWH